MNTGMGGKLMEVVPSSRLTKSESGIGLLFLNLLPVRIYLE